MGEGGEEGHSASFHGHVHRFLCQNYTLKVKKELCSEYRISVTQIYDECHNEGLY